MTEEPATTTISHRKRVHRLRRVLLGIVVGLLMGECAVRLFVPVRNVGPSFSEFDPVYLKRLKRSYHCTRRTPEFTMELTTNSQGHRGPEPERPVVRPVLFLGDSFTMGYGVNDGEEFPELVRLSLSQRRGGNGPDVVNAGIGNVGIGRWVKYLRDEAPRLDPRFVVLQVTGNDFSDDWREGLFTLDDEGGLVESPGDRSPGLGRLAQRVVEAVPGLAYSHLVSLAREVRLSRRTPAAQPAIGTASVGDNSGDVDRDALTLRLIEASITQCRKHDWPMLILAVDLSAPRWEILRGVAQDYQVNALAVPRKSERPELYYEVDGHWNKTGHAFVAERVAAFLEEHLDESDHVAGGG